MRTHIIFAYFISLCSLVFSLTNETDNIKRIGYDIKRAFGGSEHGQITILMDKVDFDDGVLFGFVGFFRNTNMLKIQIWRPILNSNADTTQNPNSNVTDAYNNVSSTTSPIVDGIFFDTYKLIGSYKIQTAILGYREFQLVGINPYSGCIRMKKGDRLGIYLPSESPIGAELITAALTLRYNGEANINDQVNFDKLQYPMRYSLAAFVDVDPGKYDIKCQSKYNCSQYEVMCPNTKIPEDENKKDLTYTAAPRIGATGESGPVGGNGATGATGPIGKTGEKGEEGEKGNPGDTGDVGPAGPQGKRGIAAKPIAGESKDDSLFADSNFVMVLFIWLIILTIITLIIIVVLIVRRNKNRDKDQKAPTIKPTHTKMVYSERPTSYQTMSDDQPQRWMNGMKEEKEMGYEVDTIQRHGSEVYADVPMITTTHPTPLHDSTDSPNDGIYSNISRTRDEDDNVPTSTNAEDATVF